MLRLALDDKRRRNASSRCARCSTCLRGTGRGRSTGAGRRAHHRASDVCQRHRQDKVTNSAAGAAGDPDVTIQNGNPPCAAGSNEGRRSAVFRPAFWRPRRAGAAHGYYVLRGGALDFRGSVRADARASQTMTGGSRFWPGLSIRCCRRKGRHRAAYQITGTARQPKFGWK